MSLCSWESIICGWDSAPPSPSPDVVLNRDLAGLGGGGGGSFFPVREMPESSDRPEEAESGRSKGALGMPGEKPRPLGVLGGGEGEVMLERSGEGEGELPRDLGTRHMASRSSFKVSLSTQKTQYQNPPDVQKKDIQPVICQIYSSSVDMCKIKL
jgi:hypothetical protein